MASKRLRRQARAEAALKYNPERRSLVDLLNQAADNVRADVKAAHSTRRGVTQAVSAIRPEVDQRYGETQTRLGNAFGEFASPTAPGQGSIAEQLQRISGPQGSAIVAAALAEQTAAKGAVEISRQRELGDLRATRLRAREGEAQGVLQARQEFKGQSGKILDQLRSLAQEQGVFQASTLDKLVSDARDRGIKRAGLRETARHNQVSEAVAQQNADTAVTNATKQSKPKVNAPSMHGAAQDAITQGLKAANDIKSLAGLNRSQAAAVLTDKEAAKANNVPYLGDHPTYLQAALDLAYNGTISYDAVKKLRARGFQVRKFGFKFNRKPMPRVPIVTVGTGGTAQGNIG